MSDEIKGLLTELRGVVNRDGTVHKGPVLRIADALETKVTAMAAELAALQEDMTGYVDANTAYVNEIMMLRAALAEAPKDAARYIHLCETYPWSEAICAAFDVGGYKSAIDDAVDDEMTPFTKDDIQAFDELLTRTAVRLQNARGYRFTLNGMPYYGEPTYCGGDLYCHVDEDGKRFPLLPVSPRVA